jgi:adenine/guanine phosphoribosyltransferase-like PRPP-binding protein
MSKYFTVSWEELHRDSRALVWRLLELPESKNQSWKGLMAVTRGGLVPAAIIARELEIRMIDTVCIASYEDREQGGLRVIKSAQVDGDGEGWLIIDDLVDTGKTAEAIKELYPKAHLATVYAKPMGQPLVDTFITGVSQDTWIMFPWDMAQASSEPLITQAKVR